MGSKIKAKEEIMQLFNIQHNNKYDYSLMKYRTNRDKIKIICPIHGIFEQRLDAHKKIWLSNL